MKATGIVRRIDDLGRVVVPKEIRRVLRIREGDPLEIYTGNTGEVILKKYSPINELSQFAGEYAETASKVLGGTIIVSDTDQVIAACGANRKEYIQKRVDCELDNIIQSKNRYLNESKIVVPIISQGDPIGSITILPKAGTALGDAELKVAEVGASFLARQMGKLKAERADGSGASIAGSFADIREKLTIGSGVLPEKVLARGWISNVENLFRRARRAMKKHGR